jgi:septal ring factor EnvC (AmiA/AmiB activator)
MQEEIVRLRAEVASLGGRESGVLGEVDRLSAELRLKTAEAREASARLELTRGALDDAAARREELSREQGQRARYLAFRLREMYKRGPQQALQRWFAQSTGEDERAGLDYAAFLSERDGRVLEAYERDGAELERAAKRLREEESRLLLVRQEAESTRVAVDAQRLAHAQLLEGIQHDREKRLVALSELEGAAVDLEMLVDRLGSGDPPALDIEKFRGLLDWPAEGRVSSGYGTAIHPRFRTAVPHPGVDIDSAAGSPFRSIFDGRVAYAAWLHGYGLTVIVDHGGRAVSVYAHASALMVEKGEDVTRGQALGLVGDTGSLRGPYLYFEVRRRGKAEDPELWLRRK